jgi:predicted small lipoprotein YifL
MDALRPIVVLLLLTLLLAGCGRKGPLYLPEDGTPPATGSN